MRDMRDMRDPRDMRCTSGVGATHPVEHVRHIVKAKRTMSDPLADEAMSETIAVRPAARTTVRWCWLLRAHMGRR